MGAAELELLQGALARYSPSGQEREVAEYLVEQMTARGFTARVDEAGNAVGELGSGPVTVLMLGHIDTVPGWIEPRLDGDRLFARGAVDAKGPFCSFVAAAASLPAEARDKLRIVVVGAVEEEIASSKGAHHVLPGLRPDYVVIGEPSGWDAVTLGYKGRVELEFGTEGPMAHRAARGESAGQRAFSFWQELIAWRDRFNAGRTGFASLDATLTTLRTDDDPMVDGAFLGADLRLPEGFSLEEFSACADGWAAARRGRVHLGGAVGAVKAGKSNPLVRAFLASIRELGGEPRFKVKTGTSDMNLVARYHPGVPVLAYGAGDSSLDHTPDEHVELAEYDRGIRVLAGALARLAGSPGGT